MNGSDWERSLKALLSIGSSDISSKEPIQLFSDEENSNRYSYKRHIDDKLALLPKRIRRVVKVNDDF